VKGTTFSVKTNKPATRQEKKAENCHISKHTTHKYQTGTEHNVIHYFTAAFSVLILNTRTFTVRNTTLITTNEHAADFTDNAEYWLKDYESPDFREQLSRRWDQVRPLYLQIHAYVRRKLRENYGEQLVTPRGPIPAHLLGKEYSVSVN
jgi:hypothetical protein